MRENKSIQGAINLGVIYSRLQCCQSRAGKDLFITDNEGNLMHHENKLSFALCDNDSKQRFWSNYSHFFIKPSHSFLPCVHHVFMLFLSFQEKRHQQVLLRNERQPKHSRVCIEISSNSTGPFSQCSDGDSSKLLSCPAQAREKWEQAAEHSENEHSQLIRLLSKEHRIWAEFGAH